MSSPPAPPPDRVLFSCVAADAATAAALASDPEVPGVFIRPRRVVRWGVIGITFYVLVHAAKALGRVADLDAVDPTFLVHVVVLGLLSGVAAWRVRRVGVWVSDDGIVIRNDVATYAFPWEDVDRFVVAPATFWRGRRARLLLLAGTHVTIKSVAYADRWAVDHLNGWLAARADAGLRDPIDDVIHSGRVRRRRFNRSRATDAFTP